MSLGCPSACDFCNTSAFFHHEKIQVFSPAEVYDSMKHHAKRMGKTEVTFILFDEDIFLDPPFVRELGRLIRSDEKTWGLRWISFGSMRALAAFTPRELRECGVEGIWIGVESGLTDDSGNKATYKKRETGVSPPQLFASLRKVGIDTIGSTILGFDFHMPQNIEKDNQYFVSLRPTLYQVGPLRPCPGTKLYKQLHEFRDDPSPFLRHQAKLALQRVDALYPVIVGLLRNERSPVVVKSARGLLERAREALSGDGLVRATYRAIASEVVGLFLRRAEWQHRRKAPEATWAPPMRVTPHRRHLRARAHAN